MHSLPQSGRHLNLEAGFKEDKVQGSGRGLSWGSLEKFEPNCVRDKPYRVVSSGA